MKILVVGDLHGLDVWKKLVKENEFDKVVFLGDYCDSFTISDNDVIQNLRDLIDYKKQNPDKVVLLLGNHDVQYIYEGNNCSGRRESYAGIIGSLFKENEKLFKIMHCEGKYFFSHAGVLNEWIGNNINIIHKYGSTYEESLNNLLQTHDRDVLFQCGASRGGSAEYSGPLWADKSETENYIPSINMIQVVGHTKVEKIIKKDHIIYCDNLEYGDGIPLTITI